MTLTIESFVGRFQAEEGFHPLGLYCQVTGKLLGMMQQEELESILPLDAPYEDAANEVFTRVLASMRPSIRWNKMRSESLYDLCRSHPHESLAYLFNRAVAPLQARQLGLEAMLSYNCERIKAFGILHQWPADSDWFTELLDLLLEIDAKLGLDVIAAPFTYHSFFIESHSPAERLAAIRQWHSDCMIKWRAEQKRLEEQVKWTRAGSPVAKVAYVKRYMEANPSKAIVAKHEKARERAFMDSLLSEVLNDSPAPVMSESKESKPVTAQMTATAGRLPAFLRRKG